MASIESWLAKGAAFAGLLTLAIAVAAMLRSLRQTAEREEMRARLVLRAPVLLLATAGFLGMGWALWHSIPLDLPERWRLPVSAVGTLIYAAGLGLYLWGLASLGRMFGPSASVAVRLVQGHRLVTGGPYAYVRHPMYLGVLAAGVGSLLLYRTWATLVFSLFIFGLRIRARREELILAEEFGEAWQEYAGRVPAWWPRFSRKGTR